MDVSFYPGCTAHSTGLEYSMSVHAVFPALGVNLSEIEDWNCCGGAAAHSLSNLLGLALPARNIAQAQKRGLPLAIPCAGCFNAVKRAQHALTHDSPMKKQLEEIVGFTYEGKLEVKPLTHVVLDDVGLDKVKAAVVKPLAGLRVCSYYGCALVRNPEVVRMGDWENPRFMDDIVTALGAEAVDWSYKVDCCGADLGMSHGIVAQEIADRISGMALEARADCVMVACGLCQINLDMRQTGKNGCKVPVVYFSELMGVAMNLPGRERWWGKHVIDPRPMLTRHQLS